jgi:hypothetical protein
VMGVVGAWNRLRVLVESTEERVNALRVLDVRILCTTLLLAREDHMVLKEVDTEVELQLLLYLDKISSDNLVDILYAVITIFMVADL